MSYDIAFRVKVDAPVELWVDTYDPEANITWNVKEIIQQSTGLEWKNEEDNGLVSDVIPKIAKGLAELRSNPAAYKHLEPDNGWGTVEGVIRFFSKLIIAWEHVNNDFQWRDFAPYMHFWII